MRVGGKDNRSMVMYDEDKYEWFPFYYTYYPMTINGYNYDFLTVVEKEVLDISEEFWIMNSS